MSAIPAEIKEVVMARSQHCCEYCLSQRRLMGASLTFDHIIPQSLGGPTNSENICNACWDCNLIKGDRIRSVDPQTGRVERLFHPVNQKWDEHFRWSESGQFIIGQTPTGRATIIALKLNRPQLVEARRYWVQVGQHPPDKAK